MSDPVCIIYKQHTKCRGRVSVRLTVQDWADLINFVEGDTVNMDPGEVRDQTARICQTIRKRCLSASNS